MESEEDRLKRRQAETERVHRQGFEKEYGIFFDLSNEVGRELVLALRDVLLGDEQAILTTARERFFQETERMNVQGNDVSKAYYYARYGQEESMKAILDEMPASDNTARIIRVAFQFNKLGKLLKKQVDRLVYDQEGEAVVYQVLAPSVEDEVRDRAQAACLLLARAWGLKS